MSETAPYLVHTYHKWQSHWVPLKFHPGIWSTQCHHPHHPHHLHLLKGKNDTRYLWRRQNYPTTWNNVSIRNFSNIGAISDLWIMWNNLNIVSEKKPQQKIQFNNVLLGVADTLEWDISKSGEMKPKLCLLIDVIGWEDVFVKDTYWLVI